MSDPTNKEKKVAPTGSLPRKEDDWDEASDSEEDESEAAGQDQGASKDGEQQSDNLSRLRREKRLAMNRESARARRKRKKMLIETLEQQVGDLTRSNEKFKNENQHLVLKVENLSEALAKQEKELGILRSIVAKTHGTRFAPQTSASGTLASSAGSPGIQGSAASWPRNLGMDTQGSPSTDLSLRRLLQSQDLASLGMDGRGLPYGVSPNRGIDQPVLSRIGRDPSSQLYDPLLASQRAQADITGRALPGQNTVSK